MGNAWQVHGLVTNLHLDWTTFRNPPYQSDLVLVGALAFHFLTPWYSEKLHRVEVRTFGPIIWVWLPCYCRLTWDISYSVSVSNH